MKARKMDARDVTLAAGLTAAVALLFGIGLATVSSPPDFKARLAAVDARAAQAAGLGRPARTPARYGAEAICAQAAADHADALRVLVGEQAAAQNLVVAGLEAFPEPTDDPDARLAPVRLRLDATGSYDAAVALLALLARERPQIFVDTLDLTPRAANVNLKFSGRVFCAA